MSAALALSKQHNTLNAALRMPNYSDFTTDDISIRFCPFEHCVRRFRSFFDFAVCSLSTLVFIWASRSLTSMSITSSLCVALCLYLYTHRGEGCVRKLARWYWYSYTDNHKSVHDCSKLRPGDAGYVSFVDADVKSPVVVEDETRSNLINDIVRGGPMVDGMEIEHILKNAVSPVGEDEDDSFILINGEKHGDASSLVVEVGSAHMTYEKEDADVHGANDITLAYKDIEGVYAGDPVPVCEKPRNAGSGNTSSSGEYYSQVHSQVEKEEFSVASSVNSGVKLDLVGECSVTPTSVKKTYRGTSLLLRRRRSRFLIHFGPGSSRCLRPRSLRRSGFSGSVVVSSSDEVEMMDLDEKDEFIGSFEQVEEVESGSCESMNVDSNEEMMFVEEPELLGVENSFVVGGKTPVEVVSVFGFKHMGSAAPAVQNTSRYFSFPQEKKDFSGVSFVVEDPSLVSSASGDEHLADESSHPVGSFEVFKDPIITAAAPITSAQQLVEPVVSSSENLKENTTTVSVPLVGSSSTTKVAPLPMPNPFKKKEENNDDDLSWSLSYDGEPSLPKPSSSTAKVAPPMPNPFKKKEENNDDDSSWSLSYDGASNLSKPSNFRENLAKPANAASQELPGAKPKPEPKPEPKPVPAPPPPSPPPPPQRIRTLKSTGMGRRKKN